MRQPAELGALTRIDAGLICFEAVEVHSSRNRVTLTVQLRNPIRVDHVTTRLSQHHLGANREHQLTRSDDRLGDTELFLNGIVVFPPPLLTRDIDHHLGVARLGEIEHRPYGEHADHGEDQSGNDGQGDFEYRFAMGLLGNRLTTITELVHRVRDRAEHDQSNDPGHREDWLLKIVDHLRIRTFWRPRVLRRI